MEMIRHGSDNVALSDKILRWARSLLATTDLLALPAAIEQDIQSHFGVPQVGMRLWGMAPEYAGLTQCQGVSEDALVFASSLMEPFCGLNTGFEAVNWLPDPANATSLALIALRGGTGQRQPGLWHAGAGLA